MMTPYIKKLKSTVSIVSPAVEFISFLQRVCSFMNQCWYIIQIMSFLHCILQCALINEIKHSKAKQSLGCLYKSLGGLYEPMKKK